jgi:hypothetical protein
MVTLVPIGNGHQLAPGPAASWLRAVAAGCPNTVTSSYRDPVTQAAMRAEYVVQLAAYNAGRRPTKPTFVARVEASEHVTGDALDLKDPAIAWHRAHPDYGWVFTDPTERWHAAYRIGRDRHLLDPVSPPIIGPTPQEEDEKMLQLARLDGSPDVYVGDGVSRRHVKSERDLADLQYKIRTGAFKGNPDVQVVADIGWLGQDITRKDDAS